MNLRQIFESVQRIIPEVTEMEVRVRANAALRHFARTTGTFHGPVTVIPTTQFDLPSTLLVLKHIRALDSSGEGVTSEYSWTKRDRTIYILDEEYSIATSLSSAISEFELYGVKAPTVLEEGGQVPEIESEYHMWIVHKLVAEMASDPNLVFNHLKCANLLWTKARQFPQSVSVTQSLGVPPIFLNGGAGLVSNQLPGTLPYINLW